MLKCSFWRDNPAKLSDFTFRKHCSAVHKELAQLHTVQENVCTRNILLGEITAGIMSTFLYSGVPNLCNGEFLPKGVSYKTGKQETSSYVRMTTQEKLPLIQKVGIGVS